MKITRLELLNFRNYNQLTLPFEKSIIVLLGNNAQGKTNILESIFLASSGKSFRTNKDSDMIQWNKPYSRVSLDYEKNQIRHNHEIFINPTEKYMKIDGKMISKRTDFLGQLSIVLFTPDDLSLVKGDPVKRRRFLDFELSQIHPAYLHSLKRYHKALKQRNMALREYSKGKSSLDLVHIWDNQLVEYGVQIILERWVLIHQMNQLLDSVYPAISSSQDVLKLRYISQFAQNTLLDENELKERFLNALLKSEKDELIRGMTLIGPQRDDFSFHLNKKDLMTYGSQGEQRSAVLALKKAEIQFIENQFNEPPIIALDDFMSELDDSHILSFLSYLIDHIQIIITTLHPLPNHIHMEKIQYYKVNDGKIEST